MRSFIVARDDFKFLLNDIEIIFLGTNGWYDTDTGNTICTLIKHKNFNIMIDAGFGIYKLDKYADLTKPSYLFISHLHIDHICGLHVLSKFRFKNSLKICIKKGLKTKLNRFLSKDYTIPIKNLNYKAEIKELKPEIKFPFKLIYLPLIHSVSVLGYRFEIGKNVIACIMDTGYCLNAIRLCKDADVFISESSYLPGEFNKKWPHLNPDIAIKIAKEAKSKKLILTHFGADKYVQRKIKKV